jgi:hypothetical protein
MQFKCINPSGAAPCVYDSRFDPDLKDGTLKGEVVRINRHVKFGQIMPWVDFASRKHFEAVDATAKKDNRERHNWLIKELKEIGAAIPDDATLSELGATYDKLDDRLAQAMCRTVKKKSRVFGLKPGVKGKKKSEEAKGKKKEGGDDAPL